MFSGASEGKVISEGTGQRTNRRISYVMATSSPASPGRELSLEITKEEEVFVLSLRLLLTKMPNLKAGNCTFCKTRKNHTCMVNT